MKEAQMTEPIQSIISPWMSDNDPHTFATVLKMVEEAGELISRSARSLMAGFNEPDPDTGRTNKVELEREMADVYATLEESMVRLNLEPSDRRIADKRDGFRRWHNLIDEELRRKVIQENVK